MEIGRAAGARTRPAGHLPDLRQAGRRPQPARHASAWPRSFGITSAGARPFGRDAAEVWAPAVVQAAVPDWLAVHRLAMMGLVCQLLCPHLAFFHQHWPHLVDAIFLYPHHLRVQLLVHPVPDSSLDHLSRDIHSDLVLLLLLRLFLFIRQWCT